MGDADIPLPVKLATNCLGGILGWYCIHPFNTLSVQMNLSGAQNPGAAERPSFFRFASRAVAEQGMLKLYAGVGAGTMRQIFYTTSRLGLFELIRDQVEGAGRPIHAPERVGIGLVSGAMAAVIACPAEMTLVRMSNDATLPKDQQRNYKHIGDAAVRIFREEGPLAFWRGAMPFMQRAMIVGVFQVGTFDQAKQYYDESWGLKRGTIGNVFGASFTSGLIYSVATMPWESAKNRMAFQRPDPATGQLKYRSTLGTIASVARTEGVFSLWNGFLPYFCRSGGHTVAMFIFVSKLRQLYRGDTA